MGCSPYMLGRNSQLSGKPCVRHPPPEGLCFCCSTHTHFGNKGAEIQGRAKYSYWPGQAGLPSWRSPS